MLKITKLDNSILLYLPSSTSFANIIQFVCKYYAKLPVSFDWCQFLKFHIAYIMLRGSYQMKQDIQKLLLLLFGVDIWLLKKWNDHTYLPTLFYACNPFEKYRCPLFLRHLWNFRVKSNECISLAFKSIGFEFIINALKLVKSQEARSSGISIDGDVVLANF